MRDLHYQRKITCPALPAIHIHREALVNQLKALTHPLTAGTEEKPSAYKLVLLHAPAGYGKTTLLVDFAQHTNLSCCWYFLDHTDTDRLTFLTLLLFSIRQCFPDFGHTLDTLLMGAASEHANNSESVNYFETATDALIRAIETDISEHFTIFLCNYHEIDKFQEINDLVDYLLLKLPTHCTLFIESRIIPNLNFAPLLAGQTILGLGINQLRFSTQQIQELAQRQGVGPLKHTEAEHLALTFDGWIAGILLGTRLGNLQLLPGHLSESPFADRPEQQISSQYLFSYVVNEVFKSHQASYAFLKDTSILQEMTPATCAALLGISPSEASLHLQSLEQHSLFVTHSGEGANVIYTCTSVLRKLFYEQLRHEMPERFAQLHQRAAKLLSASGNYSQAIHHALEANSSDLAVSLIIESSEEMMNEGHAETLARWIDAFPAETTQSYPKLLIIRANIYLRQGSYSQALPFLDAIDALLESLIKGASSPEKHNLSLLQAEAAIARSKILFQQVEYRQSHLLCKQVLANLPADEIMLRAEAHMRLGLCQILLGDFSLGIAQIQKALQLWGRHTLRRQTAEGHSSLASAYSLQGNFVLAEHHIARALVCWNQLQDIWGKIDTLVSRAYIQLRQGTAQEAETTSQEALTLAKGGSLRFPRGQAYALVCLGEIYLSQDRYELALEVTEEALALARQISDQYLISGTLCNLAMIYLYMQDVGTAMLLISEVEVLSRNGNPVGYKSVIRDLVYGTVHLYQSQYAQAWSYLSESAKILGLIGLKQEHLQALLRLAAYHLAQEQISEVVHRLEEAAAIAAACEGYKQLAQREVRHLPGLQKAIKTFPALAQAKAFFFPEEAMQATSAPMESPAVHEEEKSSTHVVSDTTQPLKVEAMSHKLTILALGEPAVYLHQEPITRWRMAKAMELFLYLLDCARPMRKEVIISALWPEREEQTTRTFYSTIYYLRQTLGGESVIVAKGGTYALKLSALYGDDVWYDVAVFEDHYLKAKQALNDEKDETAKKSFSIMIDLYRGDYVLPFYSDWCIMRRDELRRAYLQARHQLALICWHEEELDECITHWQHMLAVDNCLEEAHYGLMRCYARQGKRGLALRQYQRCKDIMEQEFGTTPKASLQNLYQRLMGSP